MAEQRYVSEVADREEFKKEHTQKGLHVQNVKEMPLPLRELRQMGAIYFELAENQTMDAHVNEIAPGGHSAKHRHSNEAVIYILSGRGYSIIQREGEAEQRIQWEEGDLLSPPAYAWHQHFNLDPERPARFLAVVAVPFLQKLGLLAIENAGG